MAEIDSRTAQENLRLDDPRSLVGSWSFERVVSDHRSASASVSHAVGTTTIREVSPTHLAWSEVGVWQRAGVTAPVSRTLAIVPSKDLWRVTFDDGRAFHDWIVDEEFAHVCARDTYTGRVSALRGGWRIVWNVAGPHKQYTITTDHRRATPATA